MTDTETETETETETARAEQTPEQEANKVLFRAIARALARMDAGKGDMKSVWTEGRTKYINDARKLAKALKKERIAMTVAPKASDEEAAGSED